MMQSVLEAIGNTPLVRLDRIVQHFNCDGTILAKLDHINPGFSKKEREALGVIDAAELDGTLKTGQTVVELNKDHPGKAGGIQRAPLKAAAGSLRGPSVSHLLVAGYFYFNRSS